MYRSWTVNAGAGELRLIGLPKTQKTLLWRALLCANSAFPSVLRRMPKPIWEYVAHGTNKKPTPERIGFLLIYARMYYQNIIRSAVCQGKRRMPL